MKHKFTHTGIVKGTFTPYRIALRKTKRYWINANKVKFEIKTGMPLDEWPTFHLDLDSIKEIKK